MRKLIFLFTLIIIVSCATDEQKKEDTGFIFYYFEGYAGERGGLYAAYSYDLKTWQPLGQKLIAPTIGEWKVFRDPCVIKKDSIYHLIWTTGKSGYGYANSKDGLNWGNEKFVTVADTSLGLEFANVWAPEFYVENDSIYVIWSSTLIEDYVPPKDSAKWWTSTWNHRFYYHSTTDFEQFTPTRKFWDAGFKSIDAVVHKTDSLYYLFFKDERKSGKNVVLAHSEQLTGPYENIHDIGYKLTEGAVPVQTDTALVLYYDYYHEYNGYRFMTTIDMKKWSGEIMPVKKGFDDVIRHGSIVKVKLKTLEEMKELAGLGVKDGTKKN